MRSPPLRHSFSEKGLKSFRKVADVCRFERRLLFSLALPFSYVFSILQEKNIDGELFTKRNIFI